MSDPEDIDCDFPISFEPNPEASPEPEELALLPPNHPLLSKFQVCLKGHLIRTKREIENEIAEIKHHVKLREQRREEQGLTLYDMQQKMKFQEKQIMELSAVIEKHLKNRQDEEFNTKTLKAENEEKIKLTKSQKTLYHERMAELGDMQSLGSNIKKWACSVEDEVKNAKRIVSRDAQLQDQLSQEKRKSDILFYRLDIEIKKRENELLSICEEEATMKEVINILNMSIANANTDLEVLQNEHKRLTQAWNEVIIAIQLRDKILFQVQDAARKHREAMKHNIAGIEAIKKQIGKEMELNKKLDSFKQRLADETSSLRRECQDESESLLKMQAKLDDLPEFLNTTETDLQDALREGSHLFTEVRKLDIALDKYLTQKFRTEETILRLAQDHLITDKATAYRLKLLGKSQEKRRNVDLSLSKVQNQLSLSMLEVEKLRCVVFNERAYNDSTKTKLKSAENKSSTLENGLKKIHIQIEIKMKLYEKINCKIEEMDHLFGDASGNPTDLKIKQLEKSIHIGELQVREHQQFWIMLQNHFVNLSQKRNDQLNEIQVTRKQLSIIRQKSLKSDQELEISHRKAKELQIFIKKFTSKLELLNDKIYKKRIHHDVEETEFDHEQAEQTQKLKIAELEILKLEGKIVELQNEIELHKDYVIDKHRETLSWETKYKMIEETIKWAKLERSVKGEIGLMKTEIHRMNIRYSQLKRAQESLVLDLEHCVMHREQIFVNASVKEHLQAKFKQLKNTSQIQVRLDEVHNRTKLISNEITFLSEKQLIDDINKIERMIYMLRRIQSDLNDIIKEDANIQDRIEEGILAKHANLEQIIRKQMRAKAYKRLNTLKSQQVILRSELTVQQLSQKQSELNYDLTEIAKALLLDYPKKKSYVFKVLHVLND
uniref:Lethal (2) 41Ab, isoform A n=3 Tax=Drosophila melanogaster TaxID=7227 RepID=A0A0B7P7M6_DROME|nr:lethal (2) 41Ab, isoform A [Drosophila melanogaster]EDP28115.1 lethal (2) 41Ab, isoform A [Drosophila melanogaster]|eukprot:NP_001104357.1 lethal (2) 41Ab, isoform A [Drosophila melanogaster]